MAAVSFDTKDLTWGKVASLISEFAALPVTWEGFCAAYEVRRQVFIQCLDFPSELSHWAAQTWIDLNKALIEFASRLYTSLDHPWQVDNIRACEDEAASAVHYLTHPLSEDELAKLNEIFGTDEDEDEPEVADWWKGLS